MIAELCELAERKLHDRRGRAEQALAQAHEAIQVMDAWHAEESAEQESHEARKSIEVAHSHLEAATYLRYLAAEQVAEAARKSATAAVEKQRVSLARQIDARVTAIAEMRDRMRASALKHVRRSFDGADKAFEDTKKTLSKRESYQAVRFDLQKLIVVEQMFMAILPAIENRAAAKAASVGAAGAIVGAVAGFVIFSLATCLVTGAAFLLTCGFFGHPKAMDGGGTPLLMLVCGVVGAVIGGRAGAETLLDFFRFHRK